MGFVNISLKLTALLALAAVVTAQSNNRACRDNNPHCIGWALRGECYKNRGYMNVNCSDTCGLCKVRDNRCMDFNFMCPGWAQRGECRNNKAYMEKMCSRSCAFCISANYHDVPHVHADVQASKWKEWTSKHSNFA